MANIGQFHRLLFIPFLSILHQNKALNNFHNREQCPIIRCIKTLHLGLYNKWKILWFFDEWTYIKFNFNKFHSAAKPKIYSYWMKQISWQFQTTFSHACFQWLNTSNSEQFSNTFYSELYPTIQLIFPSQPLKLNHTEKWNNFILTQNGGKYQNHKEKDTLFSYVVTSKLPSNSTGLI